MSPSYARRFDRTTVLLALSGLAATLALLYADLRWESHRAAIEFERLARDLNASMQDIYSNHLELQQSFNAFVVSSEQVTQQEHSRFHQYERGTSPRYHAMQFVVRVSAAEREAFEADLDATFGVARGIWERDSQGRAVRAGKRPEYFPILLLHPPSGSSLRGFDTASDPARRAALLQAAHTGKPVMTEPLRLLQGGALGFLLVSPVRGSGEPCAASCMEAIEAFSVGAYRFADVPEAALSSHKHPDLEVFLYADSAPAARPVYMHAPRLSAAVSDPLARGPAFADLQQRHPWWGQIHIGQRILHVAYLRPPMSLPKAGLNTAVVLGLGLGLTIALTMARLRSVRQSKSQEESERRYATLISNLPGVVYRCKFDVSYTMEFISDGITELAGYPPTRFFGAGAISFGELVVEEDRESLWEIVLRAVRERKPFRAEYRIRDADGRLRWVWEQGCAIYMPDGEVEALEGFVSDVSEHRAAMERLAIAQKLESLGRLTGSMAHDFNNILAIVIGSLDLGLAKLPPGSNVQRHLQTALSAALRGADVTKALLATARRQPLEPVVVDLREVVRELAPLIRQTVGPSVQVEERMDADATIARVDPGQLGNALLNLVINARDAMPGGGRILIEVHVRSVEMDGAGGSDVMRPGRYVVLSVCDTGVGMASDVAAHAFEPFFTTKERGKGTGLGLSTVYGFAQQSGGLATLDSEPGRGTRVDLYFPVIVGSDIGLPQNDSLAMQPRGSERVLLVDDEKPLLEVAREWLDALGYRVVAVSDALQAAERLRRDGDWDALITDVVMPGAMNGIQLAEFASDLHPHLRIVLMSGYAEPLASSQETRWALLEKPYRKDTLAQVLRKALDEPARPS